MTVVRQEDKQKAKVTAVAVVGNVPISTTIHHNQLGWVTMQKGIVRTYERSEVMGEKNKHRITVKPDMEKIRSLRKSLCLFLADVETLQPTSTATTTD